MIDVLCICGQKIHNFAYIISFRCRKKLFSRNFFPLKLPRKLFYRFYMIYVKFQDLSKNYGGIYYITFLHVLEKTIDNVMFSV